MSRTAIFLSAIPLLALSLVAIAPSAAAADCGSMCVENCYAGVTAGSATAYCDVFHQQQGVETDCFDVVGCDRWIATCTALDGNAPNCDIYRQEFPICAELVRDWHGEPAGVCVDIHGETCQVWLYGHYGSCIVPKHSLK